MRVALFGVEIEENLGVRATHSALVAAGHELQVFCVRDSEELAPRVSALLAWQPRVVGLWLINDARDFVLLQARELRRQGFTGHITARGDLAPLSAELLLDDCEAVDTVLHGGGEEGLVDLVTHLEDLESVRGLSRRLVDGTVVSSPMRQSAQQEQGWERNLEVFVAFTFGSLALIGGTFLAMNFGDLGCSPPFGMCTACLSGGGEISKRTGEPQGKPAKKKVTDFATSNEGY